MMTRYLCKDKHICSFYGKEEIYWARIGGIKDIINHAVKIRSVELVEKLLLILIEMGIKGMI
ncbi:hypothetical protein HNQ69_000563 [Bartonella callosciuri]|uniref:Uncharacterized protein n=1 Tax=Bartonella callosciuri TaxID=686223 RepID=A0A840NVZ2_9HYPH|nr:hypothetical protein [Bartonella callosciuri]MBB5073442.1 hypothetical protein [Bartonella callosciuri]